MTLSLPSASEAPARAGRREWIALAVLALPLLLVSMDVSVLYFAIPSIAEDLHAGATQQLWILDVYGFVLAGLLITMGAMADRIGAKRLLLIGAIAFSASSIFAACATSAPMLIGARAVLGVAGATLMPSTLAMIRTMFCDDQQRAKAVGIWTAVMTGGIALGPVLSGVLLEHFWWGSVFLINVPAMVLLLIVGPVLLPATPMRRGVRFDVVSAALSLLAVMPTVYGIKQWAADGYDVRWPLCITFGVLVAAFFIRRQLTRPDALVPAALLKNRRYLGAIGANAIATFALVGNAVFMTSYLQLVLGKSPLVAALWSLAPTVVVGAVAPSTAALVARFGERVVLTTSFIVAAGGFALLTQIDDDALPTVLAGATLLAAGLVCVMTVAGQRVLSSVTPEQAGSGAAVSEASSELGGALGIAILGSIGAAAYRGFAGTHLPDAVVAGPAHESLAGALGIAARVPDSLAASIEQTARTAYVHGLHAAAVGGAVLLLGAAVGAAIGMRSRKAPMNDEETR